MCLFIRANIFYHAATACLCAMSYLEEINSMKKFSRKKTPKNKLGKEQKKFLADICKTLAITGFILPGLLINFYRK